MRQNSRFYTVALLSIISLGVAVFFMFSANKQKNAQRVQQEYIVDLERQLELQKQLLQTDTLLVDGKYRDALAEYHVQKDHSISDDALGIDLRMAIAQRFLELEDGLTAKELALMNASAPDSLDMEQLANPQEINQLDSLGFVLEKTKVELTRTKRLLQKKSFGEYLTFTNTKGSQLHYVGQVKNGKANGYGVALVNTGSRYVGEWKDNQRHGEGTYYWKDGEYYEGTYQNDKRNGQGTYYWPNGEKYIGQWKDDRRSGEGSFFSKEGELVAKGIWKDDEMVTSSNTKQKKSRNKDVAAL